MGRATCTASFSVALTVQLNVGKWHFLVVETVLALRICRDRVLALINYRDRVLALINCRDGVLALINYRESLCIN